MFTKKNRNNPGEEKLKQKKGRADNKHTQATRKAREAAGQMRDASMALGSYTGTAHDGGIPEQDADDL